METLFRTKLGSDGRIMLPAALRKELGLTSGEDLVVSRDEEGIHLRTRLMALERAQRLVARHIPAGTDLVAELRADRWADGRREEQEAHDF
jgi:AbrB family looped-hinge helix DNA binding protein